MCLDETAVNLWNYVGIRSMHASGPLLAAIPIVAMIKVEMMRVVILCLSLGPSALINGLCN